jgi:hypothetical protein
MAFTAILGIVDAQLANIELGIGPTLRTPFGAIVAAVPGTASVVILGGPQVPFVPADFPSIGGGDLSNRYSDRVGPPRRGNKR